ncbi:hypothetical protein NQ038_00125 [Brevibacterium sp. 50QC2O2]|jgi:hypothetical protein|uniref:hypothetical protein n=1 Tax=Brevibacterium sp. 50QC2O2 TaxID=2968459 RepID=UPI00211D040A|nr:hypothetical protein [Brevibacterium sp. 50QC2O2]MCQ9387069.1 hypothetical protein [Brevibacterium sp. 50QC2O2]
MIDGKYTLTADTPMGPKRGVLTLTSEGTELSGELTFSNKSGKSMDLPFTGGRFDGDDFSISGKQKVVVFSLEYEITGRVEGDVLSASAKTSMGQMTISGTRI